MNNKNIKQNHLVFFELQETLWPEMAQRYHDLRTKCITKELCFQDIHLEAQFNPSRIQSNKAAVDKQSIQKRACFLCSDNRPQNQIFKETGTGHLLLVNPFPILPVHFTIAAETHRPQNILSDFQAFQKIISSLPDQIVFYNGPKCGASAPDHQHFQAGSKGVVPIEAYWDRIYEHYAQPIGHGIHYLKHYPMPVFALYCHNDIDSFPFFNELYQAIQWVQDTTDEPMINLIGWQKSPKEQIILVFPRGKHRPDAYFRNDEQQMLISPGAIDVGGLLITVNEQDYNRLTPMLAYSILQEVGISQKQADRIADRIGQKTGQPIKTEPTIKVGLIWKKEIAFHLNEPYLCNGRICMNQEVVSCQNNKLIWNGKEYESLSFLPLSTGLFTLPEVTIGRMFHWQQNESQVFEGIIHLKTENNQVVLINEINIESYLKSVICSEMSSSNPLEFLKASAIISRSWVLSKILNPKTTEEQISCGYTTSEEVIRWYEQSDHKLFDVCADDHCQRYQGIGRIHSDNCLKAVEETKGMVLSYDNKICDARFSKCCGGITEEFDTCWDDIKKPYLIAQPDNKESSQQNLSEEQGVCRSEAMTEAETEEWIMSNKRSFCNTKNKKLISSILNQYDQETTDFYRWTTSITQKQLKRWIHEKLNMDLGDILDLEPVKRGPGGRIYKLRIHGSKKNIIIGKELEIRRILSDTHLYSSAFIVKKEDTTKEIPQSFTLYGAGWGHGVGMCQIGAAVMASKGYEHDQILEHYFPKTNIEKLY